MLKQLNKIFALILITALMVGIALPASVSAYVEAGTDIPNGENTAQTKLVFSDVENHWAKASIVRAINLGIVNGYSDESFRPNGTVTRSEFAVMISRALKLEGEAASTELKDYTTIPSWAQVHVSRVIAKGIIQGYSDATFRPNEQLTRAQLGVMVTRAANLTLDEQAMLSFSDAPQIPAPIMIFLLFYFQHVIIWRTRNGDI